MNDLSPQFTLREWRTHMTQPVRVTALIGVSVILTVMGPFETNEVMRALPRLAYWVAMVFVSYSVGFVANLVASHFAPESPVRRIVFAGFLTGLGVLVFVCAFNGLALQYWVAGQAFAQLTAEVFVIAFIIAAIFAGASVPIDHDAKPRAPALLERLPFEKRAALVALSAEDKYVRVRTLKGDELVLMRLTDAVREVGDTVGLQVHRSHWIAVDQIVAVARRGDGALLKMSNGPEIPVSRANLGKIREVGLLRR